MIPEKGARDYEKSEHLYATHEGVELKGDLYKPVVEEEVSPALVLIHGGGWIKGSKEKWADWGPALARRGIASFAVSYRLASEDFPSYPHNLWDIASGVKFLRAKASDFGIDPSRIGMLGNSAGAHAAALLCLAGEKKKSFDSPYSNEPYHTVSPKLGVVIAISGVYDMIAQWEHDQLTRPNDHITEIYLGGDPMSIREQFYESSPIFHASTENARGTKWLVVWGTADEIVDHETQALKLVTHLRRAGATLRICELVGADHFWTEMASEEKNPYFKTILDRVENFIRSTVF